ncbi:hypothetical protein BDP27DRAFT_1317033 [Rhodocollybia butyracea]|uniref:DUF6533 domain-containing protein n=1 Tax=Rhodocollybia butyracea TaxID=206335 RepID=A0A9P5Q422_9AGAR|nr:hypothetical protein BDP27DRAFT_1317033 [Rhodocollybia butyracea]
MATDNITSILIDSHIVIYTQVAMLTLLTYDYILSFSQEVAYVWFSNWGWIKVLYLFTRYSPFIDTILAIEEKLNPYIDTVSCNRTMTFNTIFSGLGIGISDIILMIRTYAMCQRSRKVLLILVLQWVFISVVDLLAIVKWTGSFSEPIVSVGGYPSCFLAGENKDGMVNYVSLLVGETVVVALTFWQGFRDCHYSKYGFFAASQGVLVNFYRDGILFFMCILPITLGNVLVLVFAPPQLQVLNTPLRVMHSILCSRLVIHVREVANPEDALTEEDIGDLVLPGSEEV